MIWQRQQLTHHAQQTGTVDAEVVVHCRCVLGEVAEYREPGCHVRLLGGRKEEQSGMLKTLETERDSERKISVTRWRWLRTRFVVRMEMNQS